MHLFHFLKKIGEMLQIMSSSIMKLARILLKWCRIRTGYLLGIGIPWVLLHEYSRSTKKKKKS